MPSYTFTVNGESKTVDAPEDLEMLWVLRDKLGITGPKYGCGLGVCQACTCHLRDGDDITAFQPCVTPVADVEGQDIITIEGLADTADGEDLHPVQRAWLEFDAPACGYCQAGQIMTAAALIAENPNPSDDDIDEMENICRCGSYPRIREAIKHAAQEQQT